MLVAFQPFGRFNKPNEAGHADELVDRTWSAVAGCAFLNTYIRSVRSIRGIRWLDGIRIFVNAYT